MKKLTFSQLFWSEFAVVESKNKQNFLIFVYFCNYKIVYKLMTSQQVDDFWKLMAFSARLMTFGGWWLLKVDDFWKKIILHWWLFGLMTFLHWWLFGLMTIFSWWLLGWSLFFWVDHFFGGWWLFGLMTFVKKQVDEKSTSWWLFFKSDDFGVDEKSTSDDFWTALLFYFFCHLFTHFLHFLHFSLHFSFEKKCKRVKKVKK